MILGIDAGGSQVKVAGALGNQRFPSDIGEHHDLKLTNTLRPNDFIFEYEGRKGFAGQLAQDESEGAESRKGDTKAHEDAKLRVLLAIHRYANDLEHQIVVGQPIRTHTKEEKQKIKDMLQGRHEMTVNDVRKVFVIRRVEVAAEGAAVGLLLPPGKRRIIDIGSGTVNYGTVSERRFIDRDSFTEVIGVETTRLEPSMYARLVCLKAQNKKWGAEDEVTLCGGSAERLLPYVKQYFPHAELYPDPIFANAAAFYGIARKLYA